MSYWYMAQGSGRRASEALTAELAIHEMLGHREWRRSGPNQVTVPGAPGHTRTYGFGSCSEELYKHIKEVG